MTMLNAHKIFLKSLSRKTEKICNHLTIVRQTQIYILLQMDENQES